MIFKNEFIVDCKIDGVSLSLTYQNNKLIKSLTRGDGIIGEDVTRNILNIIGIPNELKYCNSNLIEIRGEVFFNRDEQRSRTQAIPVTLDSSRQALYPIDPQGQGTWIALAQSGASLCLLNNYQAQVLYTPEQPISRGQVILTLLDIVIFQCNNIEMNFTNVSFSLKNSFISISK